MISPGGTIGVLGSGQLGRMMAQAAIRMGYRVATLSPDPPPTPCAQAGAREVSATYDDLEALDAFARSVDIVTFEFENVSVAAAQRAARSVPVRPGGDVLHTTQDRLREKTFLFRNGFPVTAFRPVRAVDDLAGANFPAILKTAGFGYDGKGQRLVRSEGEARAAFDALDGQACILEAVVDFACEISVVVARGADGSVALYPPVRNDHANHILDVTTAPAPALSAAQAADAEEVARGIAGALGMVGVLAVEMFVTREGRLLVNELAPRPHNSGHWTIEGAATSQFEQQVRAVCGLPLGSTALRAPGAAMANLLGDLWPAGGSPDWPAALARPGIALHLYGKTQPRPGRKMGHLTALADSPESAASLARDARRALEGTT